MSERADNINRLRLAEHQFRLACTVNLAVSNEVQTLDVPIEWTFGKHRVRYEDFGLRQDQAEIAACLLEFTATLVLTSTIRDVIVSLFENPKEHANADVVAAYQISRLLRNAFAHSMTSPKWSIDADCQNRTFAIGSIISLETTNLNGQPLYWRHYGGPLAIFRFCRFVRESLLQDPVDPNRIKPQVPKLECYQVGRLIARRVDELPPNVDAIRVGAEPVNLGEGYFLVPSSKPR
jgi:hypothetical protein